jgi:L-aminopeptidase/D-esterase-like protein
MRIAFTHNLQIFRSTIECVEEAILNASCMANDIVGINHHFAPAVPLDRVRDLLGGPSA